MYNNYAPLGVHFVFLVGQDKQGQPATAAYAAEYMKYFKNNVDYYCEASTGKLSPAKCATIPNKHQKPVTCCYQEGFKFFTDPNFTKSESIMTKTSNAIPAHMILDAETMELRYSSKSSNSNDGDPPYMAEGTLINILKEKGLWE